MVVEIVEMVGVEEVGGAVGAVDVAKRRNDRKLAEALISMRFFQCCWLQVYPNERRIIEE